MKKAVVIQYRSLLLSILLLCFACNNSPEVSGQAQNSAINPQNRTPQSGPRATPSPQNPSATKGQNPTGFSETSTPSSVKLDFYTEPHQIASLTPDELRKIPASDFEKLTDTQVLAFTPQQLQNLSEKQVKALLVDRWGWDVKSCISQFTREQIQAIPVYTFLNYDSSNKRDFLRAFPYVELCLDFICMNRSLRENICSLPKSLPPAEWIPHLTSRQIQSIFSHPNWISREFVGLLPSIDQPLNGTEDEWLDNSLRSIFLDYNCLITLKADGTHAIRAVQELAPKNSSPDFERKILSVIKPKRWHENRVYRLAKILKLDSVVAPSYKMIQHSTFGANTATIEKFIHFRETLGPLTNELEIIDQLKHEKGQLTLLRLQQHIQQSEEKHEILKNLIDEESFQKLFLFYLLIRPNDLFGRNIALKLNEKQKIELITFDSEESMENREIHKGASAYPLISTIFRLQVAHLPLSPEIRQLIQEWDTAEILTEYNKIFQEDEVVNEHIMASDWTERSRSSKHRVRRDNFATTIEYIKAHVPDWQNVSPVEILKTGLDDLTLQRYDYLDPSYQFYEPEPHSFSAFVREKLSRRPDLFKIELF